MSTENGTMATMTLGDFITEAENYQYSKEYFNLIKECGELTLMDMYLESEEYITEHTDLSAELIDSLICEAGQSDDNKAGFMAKLGAKVSGIKSAIAAGFDKILKAIMTAFGAFVKFISGRNEADVTAANEKIEKLLTGIKTMKPEDKKSLADSINASVKSYSNGVIQGAGGITFLSPASNKYTANVKKLVAELGGIEGVDKEKLTIVLNDYASLCGGNIKVQLPTNTMLCYEICDRVRAVVGRYATAIKREGTNSSSYNKISSELSKIIYQLKSASGEGNTKAEELNPADIKAQLQLLDKNSKELLAYMQEIEAEVKGAINSAETDPDASKSDQRSHNKINKDIEKTGEGGKTYTFKGGKLSEVSTKLAELRLVWSTSAAASIKTLSNLQRTCTRCTNVVNKMAEGIISKIGTGTAA